MIKTDAKLIICSAGLFLFVLSSFAYADTDWAYKSKYSVSFSIIDRWEGSVISESRYKDDMSDHYYSHLDVAVSYAYLEWLEIGTSYRYISRSTDEGWKRENRPSINAELIWSWADFVLSDNNKLEYRIRENNEDIFRYKNKLKIEYPIEWTELKISPYASEEIFCDFDAGRLNGYRLEAGFSMQLLKNSELCIAYQLGSGKKSDNWTDTNYLITYLKISF
jgi:hypothetical protein